MLLASPVMSSGQYGLATSFVPAAFGPLNQTMVVSDGVLSLGVRGAPLSSGTQFFGDLGRPGTSPPPQTFSLVCSGTNFITSFYGFNGAGTDFLGINCSDGSAFQFGRTTWQPDFQTKTCTTGGFSSVQIHNPTSYNPPLISASCADGSRTVTFGQVHYDCDNIPLGSFSCPPSAVLNGISGYFGFWASGTGSWVLLGIQFLCKMPTTPDGMAQFNPYIPTQPDPPLSQVSSLTRAWSVFQVNALPAVSTVYTSSFPSDCLPPPPPQPPLPLRGPPSPLPRPPPQTSPRRAPPSLVARRPPPPGRRGGRGGAG